MTNKVQKEQVKEYTFIDLFAGAGGLSEGFIRSGYTPIAHVEMNKDACDTLKTRTAYHWLKNNNQDKLYYKYLKSDNKVKEELWNNIPNNLIQSIINKEISEETLSDIFEIIDNELSGRKVDVIIGGPPCQAYSVAGRARDPHGMKKDQRNFLYKYYVEFLKRYQPNVFVFENVPGILSAKNGVHLENIFRAIRKAGYELSLPPNKYQVLNAKNFNVLQDRKRVIIIGWKKELNLSYPIFEENDNQYETLRDLFSDLKPLNNGEGTLNAIEYHKEATDYLKQAKIRNDLNFVTQHIVRPNNDNDLEIYKIAVDKWNEGKRLNYSELPKTLIKHNNTESFTNRFQVVNGKGISHTVVAHIAMDGHYYIHPDKKQNRSISVREAARIQSFPDDYFFEGSRTAAFKQIGNAVPPLMAEKMAEKIKRNAMNNNTLAIIVAFYLSKFDKVGLSNLNFSSFNDAFNVCANLLNVKRNYIKLRRDEFDPVFPWRQGWKRPMDKRIIRTIEILDELDEIDLRVIVENILYDSSYCESEELNEIVDIIKNTRDKKVELGKFILRGPTGRAAEEFFYDQYIRNNISLLADGVLDDCRDLGCGYDYRLTDHKSNEYYIEVKGLSNNSGGILFTNKEWKTAKEKKDKYYLCIIRNLNNNPEIELINNPYKILTPKNT